MELSRSGFVTTTGCKSRGKRRHREDLVLLQVETPGFIHSGSDKVLPTFTFNPQEESVVQSAGPTLRTNMDGLDHLLLVTSATLVVTGALLLVTRSY